MAPDELKGPQRPNRGVTQKLKGGVLVGKAIMAALIAATMDSGNYTILEIADGGGRLGARAAKRPGWSVMGVVDVSAGWSPELAQRLQGVSRRIETEKPDLVVLAPPPWVAKPTDDAGLWERRRAQLPLWRWVAEVWKPASEGTSSGGAGATRLLPSSPPELLAGEAGGGASASVSLRLYAQGGAHGRARW